MIDHTNVFYVLNHLTLKAKLTRHVSGHTNEKLHACKECGQSFKWRMEVKFNATFKTTPQ